MDDNKSISNEEEGEKKQVKFSDNSKKTTYEKDPDTTQTTNDEDEERRRAREYFHAELRRLKDILRKESKKVKKTKIKDHFPDVQNDLEPYTGTNEVSFLINMPEYGYKQKKVSDSSKSREEEEVLAFTTRMTAIRLCDPQRSLTMDRNVLPQLETAELRHRRMEQMKQSPKPKSPRTKRPEAKQGSTRLPKFPVIGVPNQELTTKELDYCDVPMLRNELQKSYSHNGEERKKTDYQRTKQDFYRMELDKVNEYHRLSRPHMQAAYHAYLRNTPGSSRALTECLRELKQKKAEPEPQAVA